MEAALDERDLAEPAALDEVARLLRAAHAHVLAAHLHDLAALLRGGDRRPRLSSQRVGHRLLDVDVLAGRERVLGHLQVPVVRSRDHHGVDVGAGEQLLVVAGHRQRGRERFLGAVEVALVAVGGGLQLDARDAGGGLHQQRAADADADEPEPHGLERHRRRVVDLAARETRGRRARRGRDEAGLLEELPAVDLGFLGHGHSSAWLPIRGDAMRAAKRLSMKRRDKQKGALLGRHHRSQGQPLLMRTL